MHWSTPNWITDPLCTDQSRARRQSVLKQVDPSQHQGLRIALGAIRTSPAQILYVEAHEPHELAV